MGKYTIFYLFENPRRGMEARNFTTNVPKNSRSQIVFRTDIFSKIVVGCPCLLLSWKCVVNVDCPSHRWPKLTTGARTWLVLAVLCYNGYLQRLVWDVNGFKIDLPYCLFAFFVVCRRLRPFGSGVFGELALFWCSVYIPYKPMSSVMGSCLCK